MARDVKDYNARLETLRELRRDHETDWEDITAYVLPRKGHYSRSGGDKPSDKRDRSRIIDPTATQSNRHLAAGMSGGMTSPSRPWVRLSARDEALMEVDTVRHWYHNATKSMLNVFGWSNLYTALYSFYKEIGGFGTATILEEEDDEALVWFLSMTAGEFFLDVNKKGVVDTFYREYKMTARNMVDQFGESAVSDAVKKASESPKAFEYFDVCHCIQPRDSYDSGKLDNKNMPFESVYWEAKSADKVLRESGYREFPILAARWDVTSTSSVYGEGPGADYLNSAKSLQEMNKGQIKAIHIENDPPMAVPAAFKGRLSLIPGAQNTEPDSYGKGIRPLFDFRHDYNGVTGKIQDIRQQIREGFYNDLFRMMVDRPGAQPPTAREIAERHEEKLVMLSPVLERLQTELLNPLIKRTFAIMLRQEVLPPPPPEIEGTEIRVEYTSILSQAQKLVGLQSIDTFLMFVGQAVQLDPSILDKVDLDEAIDQYGDGTGVPPKIIRSDDKVAEIREARAKAEQQAAGIEQVQQAIGGAKELSQADLGEDGNALQQLTKTMTGGAGLGGAV